MLDTPGSAPFGSDSWALERAAAAGAAQAVQRARAASEPALLRLHAGAQPFDPWALLAEAARGGEPLVAIADGPSRLCLLARGDALATLSAEAAERARATGGCSRSRELIVEAMAASADADPDDVPHACAAMAFDAEEGQGPWAGWQRRGVLVPERLAWRHGVGRGARHGAVVQIAVNPDDLPDRVAVRASSALREALADVNDRGAVAPGGPFGEALGCASLLARSVESRDQWCRRVEQALGLLRSGAVRKVVPARAVRLTPAHGHTLDAVATAARLRRHHPEASCFAVGRGDGALFVGATPETLVRVRGRLVEARALAGTAPRGADPSQDEAKGRLLAASAKDRREHRLVVEAIRQVLAPLSSGLDVAEVPRLVVLPGLLHLETPIAARLQQPMSALDLALLLHPTPAVCGWPTDDARVWLRATEPLDRGLYAGPLGWWTPSGDGAFVVAIRSALVRETEAWAWAGAGVVHGSNPEAEWRETQLKLSAVREALAVRRCGA